jgi:predicted metal-dependent phosphoesterase TrpH
MTVLRVVAHVHSEWSYDGTWSLSDLGQEFRRRGYDAMLTTEHDRGFDARRWASYRSACQEAAETGILVVPGIEYSDPENCVHVLAWGDEVFRGAGGDTGHVLEDLREAGAVTVLAHPDRRDAWSRVPREWLELLTGVEVWNRKYDGWAPSRTADRLCCANPMGIRFVGLDFHTRRQFFPLSLEVHTAERTTAAVLDALRARRVQATVFGRPVESMLTGASRLAARSAESVRGAARSVVHQVARRR